MESWYVCLFCAYFCIFWLLAHVCACWYDTYFLSQVLLYILYFLTYFLYFLYLSSQLILSLYVLSIFCIFCYILYIFHTFYTCVHVSAHFWIHLHLWFCIWKFVHVFLPMSSYVCPPLVLLFLPQAWNCRDTFVPISCCFWNIWTSAHILYWLTSIFLMFLCIAAHSYSLHIVVRDWGQYPNYWYITWCVFVLQWLVYFCCALVTVLWLYLSSALTNYQQEAHELITLWSPPNLRFYNA